MAYFGNTPADSFTAITKDTFSGDGSTTAFTLTNPATTNGVQVFVENVRQEPTDAYTVSGTTLTFTAAPVTGTDNIYVVNSGTPVSTITHPSGTALEATSGTFSGNVSTSGDLKVDVSSGGTYTITGTDTSTDRTLTLPDEAGTVLTSASDIVASQLPAGSVLQVVQTVKLDTFTTTTDQTFVDITGMSVSITPSSASSKILILNTNSVGVDNGNFSYVRLVRNGTPIFIGDPSGDRPRVSANTFGANAERVVTATLVHLDSPGTTSTLTYKVQGAKGTVSPGSVFYYNRSKNDTNLAIYAPRAPSSIIVMEIAG